MIIDMSEKTSTPAPKAAPANEHLIWVDMEMSGLDPEKERILEIAVIVTDAHLNTIATAPVWVVHQDDALLDAMDAWNKGTRFVASGNGRRSAHARRAPERAPRIAAATADPAQPARPRRDLGSRCGPGLVWPA